jgi:hypothetical protein
VLFRSAEMKIRAAQSGTARAHFYECTCAAFAFTARPLCSAPLLLCIALVVFMRRVTTTLQNKFRSLASFPSLAYSLASMHFVRLGESRLTDITCPPFPPVLRCVPFSVLSDQFHILIFNSLFKVLFQFSFTVLVCYRFYSTIHR